MTTSIFRQPIVDSQNTIFGYELFDRSVNHHTATTDKKLISNLFSHVENRSRKDRCFFINTTLETLADDGLTLLRPDSTILELPTMGPGSDTAAEVSKWTPYLNKLHGRRIRISLSSHCLTKEYTPWIEIASFFKVDMLHNDMNHVKQVFDFAARQTGASVIAEKIETREQFEALHEMGIRLFQGRWLAPEVEHKQQVPYPSQASITTLLKEVRGDADIDKIELILKRDPLLSLNILRMVNSAAIGLREPVTSFRHAVMLLGMRKLKNWAVLMLAFVLQENSLEGSSEKAIVRGRFMELLCENLELTEHMDNAFMCGAFSLLDIDFEDAVSELSIASHVREALINRKGVLGKMLSDIESIEKCESQDKPKFWTSIGIAQAAGDGLMLQAIAWADSLA